jgi:hypothetical protein
MGWNTQGGLAGAMRLYVAHCQANVSSGLAFRFRKSGLVSADRCLQYGVDLGSSRTAYIS